MIVVNYDTEDKKYYAWCSDFDLITDGECYAEAYCDMLDILDVHIEAYLELVDKGYNKV